MRERYVCNGLHSVQLLLPFLNFLGGGWSDSEYALGEADIVDRIL